TRRAWIAIGLLILGLLGISRIGSWRQSRHPRVLLLGVDGADPAILERLIGAGKLPTFGRLRREGAFGPLRSREPLLSPVLWTTIATGRTPQDHGVLD